MVSFRLEVGARRMSDISCEEAPLWLRALHILWDIGPPYFNAYWTKLSGERCRTLNTIRRQLGSLHIALQHKNRAWKARDTLRDVYHYAIRRLLTTHELSRSGWLQYEEAYHDDGTTPASCPKRFIRGPCSCAICVSQERRCSSWCELQSRHESCNESEDTREARTLQIL